MAGVHHRRRTLEGSRRRSPMPDVTPIVNVALVLLIVFIVVTPMIREGIQVDTPPARSVEQQPDAEANVVLAIRADGSMYVNLKAVDLTTIEPELALAYRGKEGRPVIIKGARNLPYGDLLKLMDICKGIGAPGVDLVGRRED